MSDWHTMDTAPKDGTDILLLLNSVGAMVMIVASYCHDRSNRDCWVWETLDGPLYHRDLPTHWMPLPELPCGR